MVKTIIIACERTCCKYNQWHRCTCEEITINEDGECHARYVGDWFERVSKNEIVKKGANDEWTENTGVGE